MAEMVTVTWMGGIKTMPPLVNKARREFVPTLQLAGMRCVVDENLPAGVLAICGYDEDGKFVELSRIVSGD